MTGAPLVDARAVSRVFRVGGREVTALAPVDVVVRPGEVVAVTGPSGTGKSTLVSILAGWDAPSSGSLAVRPADPAWPGPVTVFLPQRVALLDALTVADNLALARPREHREGDDLRACAESLGIDHLLDRYPSEASIGERQRIGVARALHARARVAILDEPTAHQDAGHTRLVVAALTTPRDACAVVLATHDPTVTGVATKLVRLPPATAIL